MRSFFISIETWCKSDVQLSFCTALCLHGVWEATGSKDNMT